MNILLINHYAGTPKYGMEFRPYYMAKEWIKLGNNVRIVGGQYSHLRKEQPQNSSEIIDGINYSWVKIHPYTGNGIRRFLSMLKFVFELRFKFKKYLQDFVPDIVIASSTYPLDVIAAKKIAVNYGSRLIYEVHDLWPLSPMELGGMSKYHPFIQIMQYAENYAYKHVDAVVSMLPKSEDHMISHGLQVGKFYYVPNGIVLSDWEKPMLIPESHLNMIHSLKLKNKFIVGFAGAHGIANSLRCVIDAVNQLKDEDVELILVGSGQEKNNLINYVKSNNITNVHFLDPINKLSIPNLLKEFDLLYIGLQKQPLFKYGISPNKMFDYMMASKPIVQAIEAGNNLVEEAKCGLYVEPENVNEISKAILTIKNMSNEERKNLGENGHDFVLKNHTYEVISRKFLEIMKNLTNQ